jgi:DNA-binding HxlR family transcriptional regulator/putative sterol carrier protein
VTRGYGQFCGLARALDLVGGRWALLVVRDLLTGPKRFSQLHDGLPGIPTNVLTTRLRELEEAGIVQRSVHPRPERGVVYELTEFGRELEQPLMSLGSWGAKALGPEQRGDYVSTESLTMALRGAFRAEHADGTRRLYELRIDDKELRVAVEDGEMTVAAGSDQEPDVVLETDPDVLADLLTGRLDVDAARKSGDVRVTGTRAQVRRLFEIFRFPTADARQPTA